MTLVAAAVCPHPPLLVPDLAAGAASELDPLRAACSSAVSAVFDSGVEVVFVVGADSSPRATSFAPWGVAVPVDVPEPVPLSLLVGGWLTRGRRRSFVVVEPDLDGDECAELGTELVGAADRVGLLVMGDGSARRDERAPGWLDARAGGFDATCASALASGEPDALLALDRSLADELMVAGLPAWQVLAGAARGGEWTAEMTYDEAPYGVGYFVSLWRGSR